MSDSATLSPPDAGPATERDHERDTDAPPASPRRRRLHRGIFDADTPAGRAFDVALIALILVSVAAVSLETVHGLPAGAYRVLRALEWALTALFTAEYLLRLAAVARPAAYARSFFGIVDLLAILPTHVSLAVPGTQALLVVRVLRLLRVFRVLKLTRFLTEARTLGAALRASARKIAVFLLAVTTLVIVIGSLMYVVEGAEHGFTSIPTSVYWAVVTLTTVGYGDISPGTPLGRTLASLVMILGYGIIAVPTGIVTAELTQSARAAAAVQGERHGESGGRHRRGDRSGFGGRRPPPPDDHAGGGAGGRLGRHHVPVLPAQAGAVLRGERVLPGRVGRPRGARLSGAARRPDLPDGRGARDDPLGRQDGAARRDPALYRSVAELDHTPPVEASGRVRRAPRPVYRAGLTRPPRVGGRGSVPPPCGGPSRGPAARRAGAAPRRASRRPSGSRPA